VGVGCTAGPTGISRCYDCGCCARDCGDHGEPADPSLKPEVFAVRLAGSRLSRIPQDRAPPRHPPGHRGRRARRTQPSVAARRAGPDHRAGPAHRPGTRRAAVLAPCTELPHRPPRPRLPHHDRGARPARRRDDHRPTRRRTRRASTKGHRAGPMMVSGPGRQPSPAIAAGARLGGYCLAAFAPEQHVLPGRSSATPIARAGLCRPAWPRQSGRCPSVLLPPWRARAASARPTSYPRVVQELGSTKPGHPRTST
jgi:hypothetical protein